MVLRPGDEVLVDTCDRVGNFPHGLLTNPDALALSPNAFGKTMCLNSKKQDYIDAFEANDLIVCNEGQFAKLHSPYILNLEKKDEEPPDDSIGKYRCIAIYSVFSAYNVQVYGKWTIVGQKITGDSWYYNQIIQGNQNFLNQGAAGSVSIRIDQLGEHSHVEVLGGQYDNSFFFGELLVEWQVFNINSPSLSGIRVDWAVTATCCNDAGCSSHRYEQSGDLGTVAFYQPVHVTETVPWLDGTINRYIDGGVHIGVVSKDSYGYTEDVNPFDPGGG